MDKKDQTQSEPDWEVAYVISIKATNDERRGILVSGDGVQHSGLDWVSPLPRKHENHTE